MESLSAEFYSELPTHWDFRLCSRCCFSAMRCSATIVFIILDLPPLKPLRRVKAAGALIVFYVILSVAYIAGGAVWPQFDPEDEKGKIDKILKPKREQYEAGKVEVLLQRAKALDEKTKELTARLQALGARRLLPIRRPVGSGAPTATTPHPAAILPSWARSNGNFRNATTATS